MVSPFHFAFSGSGFLIFYYMGVMQRLIDLCLVDPKTTLFGGISEGAIVTSLTCAGKTPTEILQLLQNTLSQCEINKVLCQANGLNSFFKKYVLDVALDPVTNPGVYDRCGKGQVHIGMSSINPNSTSLDGCVALVPKTYYSLADFEEALLTTNYLPCLIGPCPRQYTTFRNQPAFDGGFAVLYEDICRGELKNCIKVTAVKTGPLTKPPTTNLATPKTVPKCPTTSPAAKQEDRLLDVWPNPYLYSWKPDHDCTKNKAYDVYVDPCENIEPDIYPGKYAFLNYTVQQWNTLSMNPTAVTPQDVENMITQGKIDVSAWLNVYKTQNPGVALGCSPTKRPSFKPTKKP